MVKNGYKNIIFNFEELEKLHHEQVQKDLIKLFDLYRDGKNLYDEYYQMEIELNHLTFFATVNYSDQLAPQLKNKIGTGMRWLEDYSKEEKIEILKSKKKKIEERIKTIYGEEKEIIPLEIIEELPNYIKEAGIRQTERVLYKIEKEYMAAKANGKEFSIGNPQE